MRRLNCAIYTRKSSEDGLGQEFNSLDAQREACEAYIVSQKHAGWAARPEMYDDGGLSGGTLQRPALQRLLTDIGSGKVQIIVVYKVDRLTRSLADFAKIVDVLDVHGASFVSVTQQFNTTTSMGRLTLNMLLSFAQFEREIAGERIRDKIAASKAKGMWMGGVIPLGYDVKDRKLVVHPVEAETVRLIFQRYAELGSVRLLKAELEARGVRSKRRDGVAPRLAGNRVMARGALYTLLQNRLYRGEIAHKGSIYRGQHDAIVDPELWQIVQDKLAGQRQERLASGVADAPSLLTGLIVDAEGRRLTPTHANKRGKRYRYYVSTTLLTGGAPDAGSMRIPAGEIESLVLDRIRSWLSSEADVAEALAPLSLEARALHAALRSATAIAGRWLQMAPRAIDELARSLIERVVVSLDRVELWIGRTKLAQALAIASKSSGHEEPIIIAIEVRLSRAGKGKRLVITSGTRRETNASLIRLIQDAFAARSLIALGTGESFEALTSRLGRNEGHFASLMRISYLAPDIVEAIMAGGQPRRLSARWLLRNSQGLPCDWREQRAFLGFPA